MLKEWTISVLSVIGAFLVGGVAGSLILESIDMWHMPGMGFGSAFLVVMLAYISAPKYKLTYTTLVLLLGAFIAWYLLEPSFFPETYQDKAYQYTHLPIISTYTGAVSAYLICMLIDKMHNKPFQADAAKPRD